MSRFICSSCGGAEDFIIKNDFPAPPDHWATVSIGLLRFHACCELCAVRLNKKFKGFAAQNKEKMDSSSQEQVQQCIEILSEYVKKQITTSQDPSKNPPKD